MPEIAYQNRAQVQQLLNEREMAKLYGNKVRVAAADKALATFGIKTKEDREAAAKARQAAAEAEPEVKNEPPAGRSAAKKSTAKG